MIEGSSLRTSISLDQITTRVEDLVKRIHGLADDFSINLSDTKALARLLVNNPIEAFVSARGMGGVSYFKFDGQVFGFDFDIPNQVAFSALLQEILEWRLAQYLSRGHVADVICRVSRNSGGQPILFLPSTGGGLPKGVLEIEVNGRPMEATIAKIAVNVVRSLDTEGNELPGILRGWFGNEVGLSDRSDRVRFRRSGNGIVMEPFGRGEMSSSPTTLWGRYPREAIPPAFGLEFNPAIWNVGFVVSRPHIFLLVTLAKDDMNPDHQYADHFLSDREFNWQSRRRTTQSQNTDR